MIAMGPHHVTLTLTCHVSMEAVSMETWGQPPTGGGELGALSRPAGAVPHRPLHVVEVTPGCPWAQKGAWQGSHHRTKRGTHLPGEEGGCFTQKLEEASQKNGIPLKTSRSAPEWRGTQVQRPWGGSEPSTMEKQDSEAGVWSVAGV